MTSTDELFKLIHSMTKSEKRYFKLNASQNLRNGKSNYLEFFDMVARMQEYDEEKLMRKLKGTKLAENLASVKYQLTQLILRILRQYHAGASVDMQIREYLNEIEILYAKGLVKLARKSLKKALELANRHERLELLLELFDWELSIIFRESKKEYLKPVENMLDKRKRVLDLMGNQMEYSEARYRQRTLSRLKPRVRVPEEWVPFQELLQLSIFQNYGEAKTFISRIMYWEAHGLHYFVKGDFQKSFEMYEELIQLWEAHPEYIEVQERRYFSNLSFYVSVAMGSENHEAFLEGMKKVYAFKPSDYFGQIHRAEFAYHNELIYRLNFGPYEEGLKVVNKIDVWLEKDRQYISQNKIITSMYNATTFFFLFGDFHRALRWLNKLISFEKAGTRQDIQDYARIFQLIIHNELGNYDLLDYLFRSTYRYLKKREKLYEYERLIIGYIRSSSRFTSPQEFKDAFQELKTNLEDMARKPGVRRPVGLQELIFWLESKIKGIGMREFYEIKLREKAQK